MTNAQIEKPKKKKTWIWILIAFFVVAVIAVAVVFVVTPSAEEEALDSLDLALNMPTLLFENEEMPVVVQMIEEVHGYEMISFEENRDGAVAVFRVYAPDVYSIAKKIDAESLESNSVQIESMFVSELQKAELTEKEVTVVFAKVDNGYKPDLTSEFIDAYYGGAYKLYEEAIQNIVERGN